MSMEPKTVAFIQASIDVEGSITSLRAYNCTVAGAAQGVYDITIGKGGVDSQLTSISVVPQTPAAGGAATAANPHVTHTSDTVKRITFTNDANVALDPAGFWIEIKRYPPLPTP